MTNKQTSIDLGKCITEPFPNSAHHSPTGVSHGIHTCVLSNSLVFPWMNGQCLVFSIYLSILSVMKMYRIRMPNPDLY